jgi:hypothetical protein
MPDPSTPAATVQDTPEVDLWLLAGKPPPEEARWLVVTAADGEPGGTYTARPCPGPQRQAFGGDVLICLEPGMDGPLGLGIRAAVWTAVREELVPVAAWQMAGTSAWPERIRDSVIFAMSVMTALGEHTGLGELDPVDLTSAAQAATPGLPPLVEYERAAPLP